MTQSISPCSEWNMRVPFKPVLVKHVQIVKDSLAHTRTSL